MLCRDSNLDRLFSRLRLDYDVCLLAHIRSVESDSLSIELTFTSDLDLLDAGRDTSLLHKPKPLLLLRRCCQHRFGSDDCDHSHTSAVEAQLDTEEKTPTYCGFWSRLYVSQRYKAHTTLKLTTLKVSLLSHASVCRP